jgi:hypothetical protein
MEFILIFLLLVVTLGAVLTWTRRGQSSIGRESGDTIAKARHKARPVVDVGGPRPQTVRWVLGGHLLHTCPRALVQKRHHLLLDDVLEVRRPPVGLEGVLTGIPLVEQERPGIVSW